MENFKELYTELAEIIATNVPGVEWVDLWHNQVNFLEEEHPFPAPAVFLSFRSNQIEDTGQNVQNLDVQVDVYLFYETFADTFRGNYNQASALDFLDMLTAIHKQLHGTQGEHFESMRRTDVRDVDTGSAQNLYRQSYSCIVNDTSAWDGGEQIVDDQGNPVSETGFQGYHFD